MGTLGGDSGSADFCRTLFEAMRDGCAHCQLIYEGDRPVDWVYLAVNPAFETLTGLRDVLGRRVVEVVPGIRESSPEIFEVAGRVAAGGDSESLETFVKPLAAWYSTEVMSPAPGEFIAMFKNITALKRAEKKAATTQERFLALFELSPDPISVNRLSDGSLVMVNRAWCQLMGVSKEEALGRTTLALGLLVRPEEREDVVSELHQQAMSTPRVVTVRTREGSERRLLVNASRVTVDHEDLIIGIGKDVTHRHRVEVELRESTAAFQSVFEMSPVPLFLQREGRFVHLNAAALRLFGAQEAAQLIGQFVFDRTPAGERDGLLTRIQGAMAGVETARFVETRILTLDGTEVDAEVLDRLVSYQGLPTILVSVHDIRERKKAEKALLDAMNLQDRTGELAKVGGCRLDVETGQQYWTPQTFRILDLGPGDTPLLDQGLDYYDPQDRPAIHAAIRDAIETGASSDLEVGATTAKGRAIRVRVQVTPTILEGQTIEVLGAIQDVTGRFEADQALRASERKFSAAFMASPDGMSLSRLSDGRFLEVNDAFQGIFGYAREEVIGRTPLPGDLGLWVRSEDRDLLQEALLRDGMVRGFQAPFRHKDGTVKAGILSGSLIDVDGERCQLFIIRDISERKRAEEALRQQEAFIRSVLDNLPVGIAVSSPDPAEAPTYMNDLFPKYYRTSREVLEGITTDPDLFWEKVYEDPDTRESMRNRVIEDVGSGDPSRMHWERVPITRKGEETTFIDARNIPVPSTQTMISTVWDVTEQVRREEETLRLEARLNRARKMESLGLLAGGVAHDINNVLAAILAVATIHRRSAADGTPLHRDMETITKACLRGGSLVKSLLGFARKDLREERWLNLNDLIREVMNLLKHTTLENITLRTDLNDRLREVKGDPGSLNQALMNLCVNAFEAMPAGGTLTVRTRNEGPHGILVEVEDTGIGMTEEVLSQAMVPFYTTKQSSKGNGLGLSIVYGTVQSHRGTLDLQSEPGRGTLVRLRFPASDSIPAEKPGVQTPGGDDASAKKSILFVDDDPLLLQAMPRAIEHLGHSVRAVANGEQALTLIDQGFRPDLVILDVNMPGIDGLETLLQFRERAPTLRVLLSTGNPSQAVLDVVAQFSGVSLIAKPYTLEDLKRQIRMAVP